MDFLERSFQYFTQKNNKKSNSEVRFEEKEKYLETFFRAAFSEQDELDGVVLCASRDFIGYTQGQIFLPECIDLFNVKEKNEKLYLHLILVCSASSRVISENYSYSDYSSGRILARLKLLESMPEINLYLDQRFYGFKKMQQSLFDEICNLSPDLLKSEIGKAWQFSFLIRSKERTNSPLLRKQRDRTFLGLNLKINETIPDLLKYTIPAMPIGHLNLKLSKIKNEKIRQGQSDKKTEKKKTYSGINEQVDLEKEKANPVTHSFEKMETADEYDGGRRIDSGDDELDSHSAALNELNLNKMTQDGESAQSLFKSDTLQGEVNSQSLDQEFSDQSEFLYPEWHAKKKIYLTKHCRLLEDPITINSKTERISEPIDFELRNWKRKLNALISRSLWIPRLKEGDEIDYDEFVREFSQLKAKKEPEGRWYAKKRPKLKDIALLVLFDQSMSSDSWVKNHRVLDVIIESLKTIGKLFDGVVPKIAIAGTWSETRHHCSFQFYKRFSHTWNTFFDSTHEISPRGYTRLGPALRHATRKLSDLSEKNKILILFTDGKPTDLDGYEGAYGIQDVKQACSEAEAKGIFVFALTIDSEAKHHFAKMFNHFSLLNNSKDVSSEIFKVMTRFMKG